MSGPDEMTDRVGLPGVGLLCGCKKVNEFVPNVCLARFHNEMLPSLRGRAGAGETDPGSGVPPVNSVSGMTLEKRSFSKRQQSSGRAAQ